MFNKSKLKKFINDGKKGVLQFDKSKGWIIDGYAMYTTKDPVMESVLQEMFYKADTVNFSQGNVSDNPVMDFDKLIENHYYEAPVITLTNYLEERKKTSVCRVFLAKDGENRLCQQKYLDLLSDFRKYTYRQNKSHTPIYVFDESELIALILPVNVTCREYGVVSI